MTSEQVSVQRMHKQTWNDYTALDLATVFCAVNWLLILFSLEKLCDWTD